MENSYDHKKIEKKWQRFWKKNGTYITPDKVSGKDNFYLLVEFPYPSGNLHVGHWYAFAVPDILARMLRMQGRNVLYPIGFDAFGLPAENAAIKNKLNPKTWTEKNIAYMTKQIESMGASFDWSRKVSTIDPEYYKWTQWLFLQLYKKGLVYQKETAVNWCPNDKTVLANEQVIEGKCERCESSVVQRMMLQWNIKITDYADRLIDDLEILDWPEQIKESQRSWIGRSEGAEIDFPLKLSGDVKHFVLLHGKGGSPMGGFKPWLKEKLEALGYTVECPELPKTDTPDDREQADYVQKNCRLDAQTAVVGHSFGGIVALRLLERGVRLGRVILVGMPYTSRFLDNVERPTVTSALKRGFDSEAIRRNAREIVALYDIYDQIVPISDGEVVARDLGCPLIRGRGEKSHFNGEREPDVLMASVPSIRVFTTRADTLFGAMYLVLAPEHPWLTLVLHHKNVLENADEVQEYIDQAKKKTELERQKEQKNKTGVELKGVRAVNPATGEEIPVWVADYVLSHYGTGAIMAVPAHDQRDFEFAKKFGLSIRNVIDPLIINTRRSNAVKSDLPYKERDVVVAVVKHWSEDKYLCVRLETNGRMGFVTGDVETGESPVDTANREIIEKTRYLHSELVATLPITIHSKFFHQTKHINCFAHFFSVLFKLRDGERKEISNEGKDLYEVAWVDSKEVDGILNRDDMRFIWRMFHGTAVYTGDGFLKNSSNFNGLTTEEGRRAIGSAYGRVRRMYKLRDWVVSRQRYWGVPIPIIHCKRCGAVPVPERELPIKLPTIKDYLPDGRGKSPLAKVARFVNVRCPKCGGKAERETDTLDTFVDSSWYFLRYTDPKNKKEFADVKKMAKWMPVDLYSGGAEHTTMHLLYSRFWHKALYDLGLVADTEPYVRRMNRSLILGPDGQKMSKSRGNVIEPDEIVSRLGADTVRMYLAFVGPYNEVSSYPWNPDGVVGVRRFLERVWRVQFLVEERASGAIENLLHRTIKKVSEDISALKFNTAISALMIFLNAVEKERHIGKSQWAIFLRLLAPFAPHLAEELWSRKGNRRSIHYSKWPMFDQSKLKENTVTIGVQVDGKMRAQVAVPVDADRNEVERMARHVVQDRLEGKIIATVIIVPGRLVNFVLRK